MSWSKRISSTLIVACAIALSHQTAHARGGYMLGGLAYGPMPHDVVSHAYAYPSPYAYAYQPFFGAYRAYYNSTGYFGSGTFSDGRRVPGTNYNPNQ